MTETTTAQERAEGALWGLFIGDALAMPVHWYYDRQMLRRDYGELRDLVAPRNPHPGSILHRSRYQAPNPDADILHDQAQYWGRAGVHYHQHLQAGENTLNLQLARLLLQMVAETGGYDPDLYLDRMVAFLRDPRSHRDTYVEEWVREFFLRRARGIPLRDCGVEEKHIGGLAGPVALLIALSADPAAALEAARTHLGLTHKGRKMTEALDAVAAVLQPVLAGASLPAAIDAARGAGTGNPLLGGDYESWARRDDFEVVGRILSTACYVGGAVPAVLHLARRHADDPERALITNTMAGGDNCYRGAVLGALLGAAHGPAGWPERWRTGLLVPPQSPRWTN